MAFEVIECRVILQVCIDVIVQRLGDATAAGMYKLLVSTLNGTGSGSASTISLYALPVRFPDSLILASLILNLPTLICHFLKLPHTAFNSFCLS